MFKFSIFTKALTDTTLSKNEFRVLCLLLNTSSFKQSDTFEMYNGFIQDTLGISERNVRDITKSLVLKNYIKKEVNTNSHNRNANTYTIIDAQKCAENCAENCPPNNLDKKTKEIKNINNNKSILEHKDIVRIVTEDKKEKNNKKEKVNEMKLDDKVTSTQVNPSSKIEDKMSGVSDKNVYIPKNTDSSITSPSEDDMDIESYTSMNLEKRGIKERKRTSTVNANKATGDVENTSMNNLSTSVEKTQPDAKEVAKTESEAKIASIMSNIDLDKEGMLKAKSQIQFDAYFDDFKSKLANLQHLVSEEAYKNYRKIQGKWWKATVKYLKYFKDAKKPQQPQQPTTGELKYYQYHLESMFIAKSVDDMDKAINQMSNWFEKMNGVYSSSVMEKYEERFAEDCARVTRTNPIFKEWQNKATGEAEAA